MKSLLYVLHVLPVLGLVSASSMFAIEPAANLWEAAAKGEVLAIHNLVKSGTAVDTPDADGLTPLMHAAQNLQFDVLLHLLRLGANPEAMTEHAKTAVDLIPGGKPESLACEILLRAHLFLKQNCSPNDRPPNRPNVIFFYSEDKKSWPRLSSMVETHGRDKAVADFWDGANYREVTPAVIDRLKAFAEGSESFDEYLKLCRQTLFDISLERGRRLSRHVQASGAGIISILPEMDGGIKIAAEIYSNTKKTPPIPTNPLHVAGNQADFYIQLAAWALVPIYENPNVLFVFPAGDSSSSNDTTYPIPAYLSRFMPNAVTATVARSKTRNYGLMSVTVACSAPAYVSFETSSDAAAVVAGNFAYVRYFRRAFRAEDLKQFLINGHLSNHASAHFSGYEYQHMNRASSDYGTDFYYERAANALQRHRPLDADRLAAIAQITASENFSSEGYLSYLRARGSLTEKAMLDYLRKERFPGADDWRELAEMQVQSGKIRWAIVSYDQAIARTEAKSYSDEKRGERINLLIARAELHLRLGNKAAAQADVHSVQKLDPAFVLPDALTTLLV
jgi:hypothetical protein